MSEDDYPFRGTADPIAIARANQQAKAEGWEVEGRKDDLGKDPWHLLPWDAVREIVKVLAFGARKYGDRNWERGFAWSRAHDALIRHVTAWHLGESHDQETGLSHLSHAGCCVLFLIAFELRGVGKDDRPKILYRGIGMTIDEFAETMAERGNRKRHDPPTGTAEATASVLKKFKDQPI